MKRMLVLALAVASMNIYAGGDVPSASAAQENLTVTGSAPFAAGAVAGSPEAASSPAALGGGAEAQAPGQRPVDSAAAKQFPVERKGCAYLPSKQTMATCAEYTAVGLAGAVLTAGFYVHGKLPKFATKVVVNRKTAVATGAAVGVVALKAGFCAVNGSKALYNRFCASRMNADVPAQKMVTK